MAKTANLTKLRRIAIVGFPNCSAWITAGLLELFALANVAQDAQGGRRSSRRIQCEVISANAGEVRASHGVRFSAAPLRRRYDAIVVPPVWGESRRAAIERIVAFRSLSPFLERLARRADIVASACSGGAILAQAGLLDGYRATTCWWLASWFSREFPDVELAADKLVLVDRGRWTSAAGAAYIHLGLELVRALMGSRTADATAQLMLVERRRGSQSPFIGKGEAEALTEDRVVLRAAKYLRDRMEDRVSMGEASRALGLSERTMTRRFKAALGMSPLTYLQSQRIARARSLLEKSSAPWDTIVVRCGYEDVASFRKLFQRTVGMTPREYRSRFGAQNAPD